MPDLRIINADVLDGLAQIESGSVHCVVTSPPYWGLRDYGTATWEGGDPQCDHRKAGERRQIPHGDGRANDSYADERHLIAGAGANYRDVCGKCGARRIDKQLGLEDTPEEYIERMTAVFREVRRVLRPEGVLWLNMGDGYANQGGRGQQGSTGQTANRTACQPGGARERRTSQCPPPGLKPKDLIGMPWRLAFALQADGWYLRSDVIWAKPNPMPESVRDRPTKSHEYVFLLTKSSRYFWDADAVRESGEGYGKSERFRGDKHTNNAAFDNSREWIDSRGGGKNSCDGSGRNLRTVWTIPTEPYPEAHFATFPTALAERCIRAGSMSGDTVLDPFAGSGTTGYVARGLGRNAILIELNPEYVKLIEKRCALPWERDTSTEEQAGLFDEG